jgi:hypothetical protein
MLPHAVPDPVAERDEDELRALSSSGFMAGMKSLSAAAMPEDRKTRFRGNKKEELLRELADTVGERGQPGQDFQNVISVAMLSEAWDVTHIMGSATRWRGTLRAPSETKCCRWLWLWPPRGRRLQAAT